MLRNRETSSDINHTSITEQWVLLIVMLTAIASDFMLDERTGNL